MVEEALDQRPLLLASLPPSRLQTRLACGIVVTMLVLFVVTLRYVNVPLPRIDAFVPIHAITTLINDLITAILLFSQYSIERRRTLLVIASGYLFTALIVIPWALTFPGLFAPTGLLGPGLQTTAWLYTSWHIGSPLILLVAVLLKDPDSKPSESLAFSARSHWSEYSYRHRDGVRADLDYDRRRTVSATNSAT